jgi:hypothetical protein
MSGAATTLKPLALGDLIGHRNGAGSLGFFARRNSRIGFVCIAPAVAPDGAQIGDWIYAKPVGAFVQLAPSSRVGRLAAFTETVAFVELAPQTSWAGNVIDGTPLGDIMTDPDIGAVVGKIGAATGVTTGRISAHMSTVRMQTDKAIDIPDLIEVTSGTNFSAPGDGGALVFSARAGDARHPVGIILGSSTVVGGSIHNPQIVYVVRMSTILSALELEWLGPDDTASAPARNAHQT